MAAQLRHRPTTRCRSTTRQTSPSKIAAHDVPALLVDSEPGREPLGGEVDFLRIALASRGNDTPTVRDAVVQAKRVHAGIAQGSTSVVVAGERRSSCRRHPSRRLDEFVSSGGGLLIAPGDQAEAEFAGDATWMPAAIRGDEGLSCPRRWSGPCCRAEDVPTARGGPTQPRAITPAAGRGRPVRVSAPRTSRGRVGPRPARPTESRGSSRRPHGRGRVIRDRISPRRRRPAACQVNPTSSRSGPRADPPPRGGAVLRQRRPPPASQSPSTWRVRCLPPGGPALPLQPPDGATVRVPASRSGESARVRYADTAEPGIYRLTKPNPPGGYAYALVALDPREADPARLDPAEAARLAEGWPLAFESDPDALPGRIASGDASPRREVWRWLIFAALGGLCVEVWMTRRMARTRGLA